MLLRPYIRLDAEVDWSDPEMPVAPIQRTSPGLQANAEYFGHPEWGRNYFLYCHRGDAFRDRWREATGSWDGKIVVDIGCGPGNVFATVGGRPKLLIGVDVSAGALGMARQIGYVPIVGDAQNLPFVSGFADLVVLNAALHHCDDMQRALEEAARIVAPGGVLVADHDPQLSAWEFRGLARLAWEGRLIVYLGLKKGFHRSTREQAVALASEIHHRPGHGVTRELFESVLIPGRFDLGIFPHNHDVGREIFDGDRGRAAWKFRIAQRLSGLDPDSPAAALSLLCRARKRPPV